ncbi:MAG: hypothetical protein Q7S40_20425 [Opitutaceae bacterium]|nr:hypothetical protein [Opitutaceae bacterium]
MFLPVRGKTRFAVEAVSFRLGRIAVAAMSLALAGGVAPAQIPAAEALLPPTSQRAGAIVAAARRDGWPAQVPVLRAAAVDAYRQDKLGSAEAWYHACRWARVFGQTESEFFKPWTAAVNAARVGHANMPSRFELAPLPLAGALKPELQTWLVGNAGFSAEFFGVLSPVDYLPKVLAILAELHRLDPARFKTYANLALAIAVVYDVPPPPVWPHGQVRPEALPRKLPAPADAFAWWIRQEQLGHAYHRISRLGADELKFVVDAAAPPAELEWAQQKFSQPLNQLPAAYSLIRYRQDRVTAGQGIWPGTSYKLSDILTAGGICADQAYFATQVGKSRGVPTLHFNGAGNDGRHAWFGFLDGSRKWQLDAGRYAEQRFVTGYARDPQTWAEITDHELQFLAERFRELPSYRSSRVHAAFAAEFLGAGDAAAAATAARKAVNFERRNQSAWETLIAATRQQGRDAKTIEALLREAALAFQRYPDLQAHYLNRVADSLRSRGQTSEAEAEIRGIALNNKAKRGDLSVQQAREIVVRAATTQPLAEQIKTYNSVVDTYGRGAGMAFFDQVVAPFVDHLMKSKQNGEALKAAERARRTLKIEPNSQLETEFARLLKAVREAKPGK